MAKYGQTSAAAKILSVHPSTIRRAANRRALPAASHKTPGGHNRIDLDALKKHVNGDPPAK